MTRDRPALDEALARALGRALAAELREEMAAETAGVELERGGEHTSPAPADGEPTVRNARD